MSLTVAAWVRSEADHRKWDSTAASVAGISHHGARLESS